jgi:hypothetical protein
VPKKCPKLKRTDHRSLAITTLGTGPKRSKNTEMMSQTRSKDSIRSTMLWMRKLSKK